MSSRLEILGKSVRSLYEARKPDRADWADWMYDNHIFVVSDYAKILSGRFGIANPDMPMAAALLHDIADAEIKRENPDHEKKSEEISLSFLIGAGFAESEVKIVVGDAIKFHGCKNGEKPKSPEGQIMATADALAHLRTDFYDFALRELLKVETKTEIKGWALPKIERDFNDKIFFDEVREEARPYYERVKNLFAD